MYNTHLPSKFHNFNTDYTNETVNDADIIIVRPNGALEISQRWEFLQDRSQWTGFDGRGERIAFVDFAERLLRTVEGSGRRWAWVPWTEEMERSYGDGHGDVGEEEKNEEAEGKGKGKETEEGKGEKKLTLKLRFWNSAMESSVRTRQPAASRDDWESRQKNRN